MYLWYLLVFFRLPQAHMEFSSQTCNKMISKIVIRYRDYCTVFLGRNETTNEVDKQGNFYQYITNAVPRCCPNLPVEFIFEDATEQDTIELVMANLTNSSKRPRPFVFYFPEFMGQHIKRVYDFQLFYIKLSSSSGQAVVMYSPDESARRKMTADTIVKSSVLLLILMLALSWLFGILGWAADHWKNPKDFPAPFVVGMFEGVWWSIITMSTVGYGDKTTKSLPARIVAVIWVMFSAIMLTIFTAHVTNVLDRSLVAIDYSNTLGLQIGVLLSKEFDEFNLNLGAHVKNYRSINDMFTAIKNQEVDRLLFPDYQFLRTYFASPLGRSFAKDYHIVKVFRSPFQIGMVLAIDPEVLNHGIEERFVRCLRNEITLEEKRAQRLRRADGLHLHPLTEKTESVINTKQILILLFYTLGVIACLVALGIVWDIWRYIKRRKTKEIQLDKRNISLVEKVMPVLH